MADYPPAGNPYIFMHRRGRTPYHPAIPVAFSRAFPYFLRLFGVPKLFPGLVAQIAHNRFLLHPVARDDIAEWVDKKSIPGHIAGQQALIPINIINQPMIEIGPEPFFRRFAS